MEFWLGLKITHSTHSVVAVVPCSKFSYNIFLIKVTLTEGKLIRPLKSEVQARVSCEIFV